MMTFSSSFRVTNFLQRGVEITGHRTLSRRPIATCSLPFATGQQTEFGSREDGILLKYGRVNRFIPSLFVKGKRQVSEGDCYEFLRSLPKSKFQIAFLDLPYNLGIDYNNGCKADKFPPHEYVN